nr:ATP-binding cassette domain-containing protein [Actinopolyspora erythraea]
MDETEHADRGPPRLSGGQRERVALTTVLACDPRWLVFDEPSAGLEPVARRELAEPLLALSPTMLMVTRDLPLRAAAASTRCACSTAARGSPTVHHRAAHRAAGRALTGAALRLPAEPPGSDSVRSPRRNTHLT